MAKKIRATGWKIDEDKVLCKARLMFGNDAEYGNNQKEKTLWEKIQGEYDSQRPEGSEYRDVSGCKARWKRISKECMVYGAALSKAEAAHASGENYTDMKLLAKSNYYMVAGTHFKLDHCWELLQNEPKFQNPTAFGTPISLDDDDTPGSESGPSPTVRPMGQKATKAARRKKNDPAERSKAMEEYLEWSKAQELEAKVTRAQEFANLREDQWMQVDPTIYTPKKRMFWERRQKTIMDREMADSSSSSQPSSSTARNIFERHEDTEWFPGE